MPSGLSKSTNTEVSTPPTVLLAAAVAEGTPHASIHALASGNRLHQSAVSLPIWSLVLDIVAQVVSPTLQSLADLFRLLWAYLLARTNQDPLAEGSSAYLDVDSSNRWTTEISPWQRHCNQLLSNHKGHSI